MTKKKKNRKSKKSKKKICCNKKKICCNICLNGTFYRGASGLYYHMKTKHGIKPKTRNRVLPNEKGFGEDGAPRRQGPGAPKKAKKKNTTNTNSTTSAQRCLDMTLSYVPSISPDFWSEENEYRRVSEVLIETGQRLLSQLYYD